MTPPRPPRRPTDNARRPWQDEAKADVPAILFGIHAVEAAIRNPQRTISALSLTENAERRLEQALREARPGMVVTRVSPRELDRRLGPGTVHQGALADVAPLAEATLAAIASRPGPVLVLDQVTDPHNVGAVLRSAAVFGAAGLVMTRRHSPPLFGALAKSASGALEVVPVALVANLARALTELGELGRRRIGLDGSGPALIDDEPLAGPVALVLGAEGKGLRQLTRETCDVLCRIGAEGPLASLNVSNAAAVVLHLAAMRRRAGGAER